MFLLWVEPGDEFVKEEPVEYANEEQAFNNSKNFARKMTATLDLTTIIAMLVASFYRYAALPITCSSSLPKLPCQPLTFSPFLANRCLAMLPLLLSPSYSIVSCR